MGYKSWIKLHRITPVTMRYWPRKRSKWLGIGHNASPLQGYAQQYKMLITDTYLLTGLVKKDGVKQLFLS